MVNKPLTIIRPYFWGGTLGGGWLTSHKETGKKIYTWNMSFQGFFCFFWGGDFFFNGGLLHPTKNKTFQGVLQERRTISDTVCIAASKKTCWFLTRNGFKGWLAMTMTSDGNYIQTCKVSIFENHPLLVQKSYGPTVRLWNGEMVDVSKHELHRREDNFLKKHIQTSNKISNIIKPYLSISSICLTQPKGQCKKVVF